MCEREKMSYEPKIFRKDDGKDTPMKLVEKSKWDRLVKLLAETAGCLQDLVDLQNGPPLLHHKQEWELTMKMAEEIIAEVKNENR